MKNIVFKTITGALQSSARSLLTTEIKKVTKGFFSKKPKIEQDIEKEIISTLGFSTQHFKLDKEQNVIYKSSALFFHEWLTSNPAIKNKIVKDEENGQVYFEGHLLNNQIKVDLLNQFSKTTGITSPSLNSHFDNALKLLDITDYTSIQFTKEFSGWVPGTSSVIDPWLTNVFGTLEDSEYASFIFKKWIVGTATRAMIPGSSLDGCLTLHGPANIGKTRFFRSLLPAPFNNRTGEIFCNIKSSQKFVESIVGKTVACFDELSVLDYPKTEETFKQLLTSQFIDTRLVWRRDPQRYALRQGFAATTNKPKFINDKFLSRRLWTIPLKDSNRINLEYLQANSKQLWMEAVYLAQNKFATYLNPTEQLLVEEHNKRFEI